MSRVVVVHVVGRQLDAAETLLAEVEPALRGGVGLALRRGPTLGRLTDDDITRRVKALFGSLGYTEILPELMAGGGDERDRLAVTCFR